MKRSSNADLCLKLEASNLHLYLKSQTSLNTHLCLYTTLFQSKVGDFGWGPGFPSEDPEHRCAFHYYGAPHNSTTLLLSVSQAYQN